MGVADVLDVGQDAIFVLLLTILPVLGVGLTVGVIIALVQALTQIQEMTLVFVPKIIAVFLSLLLFMPFMIANLMGLMDRLTQRIAGLN
jgi:flagellar biosynthetic protein FliQ